MKKRIAAFVLFFSLLLTLTPFDASAAAYGSSTINAYQYLSDYIKSSGYYNGMSYRVEKQLQQDGKFSLSYYGSYISIGLHLEYEDPQIRSNITNISAWIDLIEGYWNNDPRDSDPEIPTWGHFQYKDYYQDEPEYFDITGGFHIVPGTFSENKPIVFDSYSGKASVKDRLAAEAPLYLYDVLCLLEPVLKKGGFTVADLGFAQYAGHKTHRYWKHVQTEEPTCAKAGSETATCYVCGTKTVKTIPALPHTLLGDVVRTKPTATQPGSLTGECSVCKQKYASNEIPPIFTDTSAKAWYAKHVDKVYDLGLMNGVGEHTFAPNASVTRAMAATVLYRIAGKPKVEGASTFTDVAPGKYYSKAVIWAQETGVVNGYPDGTFRPDENITREQLAAILCRYAAVCGIGTSAGADLLAFPDGNEVHNYAKKALAWAVGEKLITGVGVDGKTFLQPTSNATRAQFATIISRYLSTIQPTPEEPGNPPQPEDQV